MEEIRKNNKKIILKMAAYIVFLWWGYEFLLGVVSLPAAGLIYLICLNDKICEIINNNFDIFLLMPICSPLASYMLAKLFGIFNFVDNLKINMFKKILLLIFISSVSYPILLLRFIEKFEDLGFSFAALIYTLIPAFFLYKYFQYLTKKFPAPFEKIGHYCSIEFWKKLILRK